MSKMPLEPNIYSQGIRAAEKGEVFLGSNFIVYPRLRSTMPMVKRMIRRGEFFMAHPNLQTLGKLRDGMTVIALHQTAGVGSGNRKWESGNGNLMFSRATEVREGEYGQEMEMSAACAVAIVVQKLLRDRRSGAQVSLKYPNDVLINGAKVCGCLVPPLYDFNPPAEKPFREKKPLKSRIVNLGIGVNLKTAPEVPDKTTTCLTAHGIAIGIGAFMEKFEAEFAEILAEYRTEKDFNTVLDRMGFLDSEGAVTLRENRSGKKIRGTYAGFRIGGSPENPFAFIGLRNEAGVFCYRVHGHSMTGTPASAPQRKNIAPIRRPASLGIAAHG